MSEDNNQNQNETLIEIQNETSNKENNENKDSTQELPQNNDQDQTRNHNLNEKNEEPETEPVFGQTQSKAESDQSPQTTQPSLKDLKRQIAVLTVRIEDANQHSMVYEDNLRKNISNLTTQNALLRTHLKSLDNLIKKLSLLHSQLSAAPNYKLAKPDVEEMIRLVSNL